jgi:hypothetical protein
VSDRKVEISPVTLSGVTYVSANLRASDVAEFNAIFPLNADAPSLMLATAAKSEPAAYQATIDGQPALVFGVMSDWIMPHYGVAWGWGTDAAWRCIPETGRFIKETVIPQLLEAGIRRVEVRVIASSASSQHWLAHHMGAKFEAEFQFGFSGDLFRQYSWTASDFLNV